jgi:hypothetical protein
MTDELIETDFELDEQVFVPAGDGAPAQWKPKGELLVDEMRRHVQHVQAEAELHGKRFARYEELIEKGRKASTAPDTLMLDKDEMAEFIALKRTLDAMGREIERRQAAIDRDIAAGRYRVLRLRREANG